MSTYPSRSIETRLPDDNMESVELEGSGGWCRRCQVMHTLPKAGAFAESLALMAMLHHHRRIDWHQPVALADPRCSTEPLFGEAGGKMFGVLCSRDRRGELVVSRAFSGQFNGLWQIEGWVDPIFDPATFTELVGDPERQIKRLGTAMAPLARGSEERQQLRRERRALSRRLMRQIHALYHLVNFRGETMPLTEAFCGLGAPPSGTGDCCGPKLLHHAARHGLHPQGLTEFYWGRINGSGTMIHGRFYPACTAKCAPILGFQLCGLA